MPSSQHELAQTSLSEGFHAHRSRCAHLEAGARFLCGG